MLPPLRFHPFLRPMVWGGRALADRLGKHLPDDRSYGESWEVSDHRSHHSEMSDGRTLRLLMEEQREAIVGAGGPPVFPWLIKFLDCHDWLSVQVHPDDEGAKELWPGEGGKTEAWFILEAGPGSRIYAGLKPGVDEQTMRRAIAEGTTADCLHAFEPRPGDCLFLPAGTVHAVGGGVLMAEVQQTSDATFRLFDWNRVGSDGKPRELHIDKGLKAIDWQAGPVHPVRAEGFPTGRARQRLATCPFFHLDYVAQQEPFSLGSEGRLQAAIVLHGGAAVGGMPVSAGDTLTLAAATGPTLFVPSQEGVAVLVAELPTPP